MAPEYQEFDTLQQALDHIREEGEQEPFLCYVGSELVRVWRDGHVEQAQTFNG